MKKYYFEKISDSQRKSLLKRKAISSLGMNRSIEKICSDVKRKGIKSAIKYAKHFDGFSSDSIYVTEKEFNEAEKFLS
jgi:histidinol dehydrogenase